MSELPSKKLSREELKARGLWCSKHDAPRDMENDCHRCHGDGEIEDMDDIIGRGMERCYACGGSGVGHPDCEFCRDELDYEADAYYEGDEEKHG